TASWRVFDDLAHELFHNIQAIIHDAHHGARAFNLDRGAWIREGMAEAVGTDTSERVGAVRKSTNDAYRLGTRNYGSGLASKPGGDAYATHSFWRYLGEAHAAKQAKTRAAATAIPPDYSYLVKLL